MTGILVVELYAVTYGQLNRIASGEYGLVLLGILEQEVLPVRGGLLRVELHFVAAVETAAAYHKRCRVGCLAQEPFAAHGHTVEDLLIDRQILGSGVVFTEGTLEEGRSGLEGQGRILGQTVLAVAAPVFRQSLVGPVAVLEHLHHHISARVARLGEFLGVGGTEHLVVVRHISELAHHFEIYHSPEEICDAVVFLPCRLVAVDVFLEEVVHVPEGVENAGPRLGRRESGAFLYGGKAGREMVIRNLFRAGCRRRQDGCVKAVGKELKFVLGAEECLRRELGFRQFGKETVAGYGAEGGRNAQNYMELFHFLRN